MPDFSPLSKGAALFWQQKGWAVARTRSAPPAMSRDSPIRVDSPGDDIPASQPDPATQPEQTLPDSLPPPPALANHGRDIGVLLSGMRAEQDTMARELRAAEAALGFGPLG